MIRSHARLRLVPTALAALLGVQTFANPPTPPSPSAPLNLSGVMPALGLVADHEPRTEAGTGALMPWADRLWIVTYVAHTRKRGAGTGLYELREDMVLRKRPESVVGTYANRFIHAQSNQLIIGPHFIDTQGNVRTATDLVEHRLAATMAHLTAPQSKVYFLTMEGLFIECDVQTLATTTLFDLNKELDEPQGAKPHFKSAYTQHGRVVVANNSYNEKDHLGTWQAGRLAEWDGKAWTILEHKAFVEVSGANSFGKPIYALGFDRASAILKVFLKGRWLTYRVPKGSYTFDETSTQEWTRIREVETERALMDCHGLFYELSYHGHGGTLWGIRPISTHLRMVPDFCSWRGLLVLGGNQGTPMKHNGPDTNPLGGQPQAGLWFGKTDDLWSFGKPKGMGGVWHKSLVKAHAPSDAYLMLGFDKKSAHFYHDSAHPVTFTVEVDIVGDGEWKPYQRITVPAGDYSHHEFPDAFSAHWLRVTADRDCAATAFFIYN